MKKNLANALQTLTIFLIALIFIALGKWQLDRAHQWQEMKAAELQVDTRVYSLTTLVSPEDTLTNKVTNKKVQATGHYIATFRAPNQIDKNGDRKDWEVSLLQVGNNDAIVVVRGLWSERLKEPQLAMSSMIDVEGTLQPHQSDDRALASDGSLSRIDSALVTQFAEGFNLYDGYIAITSEKYSGGTIERSRVAPPFRSAVPGFYWQHISYVAIWWLMAALFFYLPFYNRRISNKVAP